jgi:hypothetical protein
LPSDVSKQKTPQRESTAMDIVVEITRNLLSTCIMTPDEGRCNFLKFDLNASDKNATQIKASLQLIVGDKGRFSALFKHQSIGEGGVGYGSYPWMLTPKTLFMVINNRWITQMHLHILIVIMLCARKVSLAL